MNNKYKGISILLFCTAMYGLYGIYSRLIATGFNAFNQNWIRNIFVLSLAFVGILLTNKSWVKLRSNDIPWLLAWNMSGATFVIALFFAFNNLPIGTALFLLYAGGTITSYIAGRILLHEKLTHRKIVAILFSLIGLIFIFGGQIRLTSPLFLGLGLVTGIVSAGWNIFPKKISHDYPKLQLIVFDAGAIIIVNLILSLVVQQPVPQKFVPLAWLGLLGYGITQFFGDLLLIHGFRQVEAHIGSLIMPMEAVFGALFAFLVFHETLQLTTILGGILILIGAIIPSII